MFNLLNVMPIDSSNPAIRSAVFYPFLIISNAQKT